MNRRRMLSLLGISPAILAGRMNGASYDKKADNKKASSATQQKIEGSNPRGIPPAIQLVPTAPRLKTLDGKTSTSCLFACLHPTRIGRTHFHTISVENIPGG
jgi:hypothetical protein